MTAKNVYTWQQFGNTVDKGANGLLSYAGSIETQAAHGRVKLQVESFQGTTQPRVGIEITRRGHGRAVLTDATMLLSLSEAVGLCGHLHAAIMAAQTERQSPG